MKTKVLFSSLAIFCLACGLLYGQDAENSWFSVSEIAEGAWLIDDHGADNMYLVEGSDRALLIDTGLGVADLISQIEDLTDKSLIVVNTHGHPDHSGSNYQFDQIYMHAADTAAARGFNRPSTSDDSGNLMMQGEAPAEDELYKGERKNFQFVIVSEGYVFDLGGRHIRVIETPGHTAGSICLLDVENKRLFTGDCNNGLVWAFLPGTPPLHTFLETLEKQKTLFSEFDTLYPGHGPAVSSDFINDQIACMKSILDGTCESRPYESFAGNAQVCTFGRSSVAYDPDNL